MKKKILLMAALFSLAIPVQAAGTLTITRNGKKVSYNNPIKQIYINNKKVSLANTPIFLKDNTYLGPAYDIFKNSELKVTSTAMTNKNTITMTYNGKSITLKDAHWYCTVGGKSYKMGTCPMFITYTSSKKDRWAVPLNSVCTRLGLKYTKKNGNIYISGTPNKVQKKEETPKKEESTTQKKAETTTQTKPATQPKVGLQASKFKSMTNAQFIKTIGPMAQDNYHKSGVLASVTTAQAILESGWGSTELCQKANNIFGMKQTISGNTWAGTVWDGKTCSIITTEEYGGKKVKVRANFRAYPDIEHSIADHSAYLLNAKKSASVYRYAGLNKTKSYVKQITIIYNGGYCTWSDYKDQLIRIIKQYNLTQYDK